MGKGEGRPTDRLLETATTTTTNNNKNTISKLIIQETGYQPATITDKNRVRL